MNKNYDFNVLSDFENDCRKCVVIIALDDSGSMSPKEEIVYEATKQLLQMLVKENETNIDFEFRVILMVFNDDVKVINTNDIPLPPEQVLELFDRSDYKCAGRTSLAAVFRKLDELFSRREGGLLSQAQKGDPYPLVIFISDYVATDAVENYDSAKNILLSNRFYEKTNRLCVYVGSGNRINAAAELVGSEDNVIAIEGNLDGLLAPVIMGSTVMAADATHIGNADKTPADVAKEQQKKAEEGQKSAEELKDEQLQEELRKLFEGRS